MLMEGDGEHSWNVIDAQLPQRNACLCTARRQSRVFGVRSTYKLRSETYFLDGPLTSICANVVCLNFTSFVTTSDQN